MNCKVVDNKVGVCQETIDLIFDNIEKQKVAVQKFISRNNIRIVLLQGLQGLPGPHNTGHEHTGPTGGVGEMRGLPDDSGPLIPVLM